MGRELIVYVIWCGGHQLVNPLRNINASVASIKYSIEWIC